MVRYLFIVKCQIFLITFLPLQMSINLSNEKRYKSLTLCGSQMQTPLPLVTLHLTVVTPICKTLWLLCHLDKLSLETRFDSQAHCTWDRVIFEANPQSCERLVYLTYTSLCLTDNLFKFKVHFLLTLWMCCNFISDIN